MAQPVVAALCIITTFADIANGEVDLKFHCKPKVGCKVPKCDPIRLDLVDVDPEEILKRNEYPITCEAKKIPLVETLIAAIVGDKTSTPGQKGEKGERGKIGPTGPVGPKSGLGKPGSKGQKGTPGFDGADGRAGPKGPRGSQGYRGVAGPKGKMGTAGPRGPKGARGPPGPPGTCQCATARITSVGGNVHTSNRITRGNPYP